MMTQEGLYSHFEWAYTLQSGMSCLRLTWSIYMYGFMVSWANPICRCSSTCAGDFWCSSILVLRFLCPCIFHATKLYSCLALKFKTLHGGNHGVALVPPLTLLLGSQLCCSIGHSHHGLRVFSLIVVWLHIWFFSIP